ncbi:MAG: universal stress protein [Spirochaetota bacterium]
MEIPKNILFPTDFSKSSDKALEGALMLAQQFKAQLYVLHVVEDIKQCAADYCLPEEMLIQYQKESVSGAKKKIEEEIKKIPDAKNVKIISDVKTGIAYDKILKEADEKKIDFIVIATHGKSGLLHHPLGSIAERVARGAKCPVMLLRL